MKTVSIAEAGKRLPELLSASEPLALTKEQRSEPAWVVVQIQNEEKR